MTGVACGAMAKAGLAASGRRRSLFEGPARNEKVDGAFFSWQRR